MMQRADLPRIRDEAQSLTIFRGAALVADRGQEAAEHNGAGGRLAIRRYRRHLNKFVVGLLVLPQAARQILEPPGIGVRLQFHHMSDRKLAPLAAQWKKRRRWSVGGHGDSDLDNMGHGGIG